MMKNPSSWKRLRLKVSERRTKFAAVFETDLDLDAGDCGGPIFSSKGNAIGVVISRAGHHATLVIPILRIAQLFAKK
jgi:S1-C subfamily serine protease